MEYDSINTILSVCEPKLALLDKAYKIKFDEEIKDLKKWSLFLQTDKASEILKLKGNNSPSNKSGSLILYLIGASSIDPILNKLETIKKKFGKADPPDIDIDFHPDIRDEVKKFLVEKFGSEHVCSVGTVGTYKTKNVIQDVARALDLDIKEAIEVTKSLEGEVGEGDEGTKLDKASFDDICAAQPALKNYFEKHEDVRRHSEVLRNQAKNYGTHAGGVIISNLDITNKIPVFRDKEGRVVSAWAESGDHQELSSIGFVKFDCLGLLNLPVIDGCLRLIKENRGIEIKKKDIPIDDKESIRLGTKGDLFGIFQFENPYTKKISDKVGVDCLNDIAAITSLIRPGPKDVGLDIEYALRKNGKKYDKNPILDKVLGKTYSVLTFQEQVSLLGIHMAGMSPLKANSLRKACSKKRADLMAQLKPEFIQGSIEKCVKTGIMTPEQVENIWDMIESTASYSFNKSVDIETPVWCNGVIKKIKEIKSGDTVLSYENGEIFRTKVIDNHDHGFLPAFEVEFDNGERVVCSILHKFVTAHGKVPLWKLLLNGDVLFSGSPNKLVDKFNKDEHKVSILSCKLLTVRFVGFKRMCDLEVDHQSHNYILENGLISSNSHAIAYSAITTVELWLRHHYFPEYMTSLIQNADPAAKKFGETFFDKYIRYAISGGVKVHKPDVNMSGERFRLNGVDLWFGMGHVKNVSSSAKAIEEFQPYTGMDDFYERCKIKIGDGQKERRPNSRVVESLIYSGAFDRFGTREKMMKRYYELSGKVKNNRIPKTDPNIKLYIIPEIEPYEDEWESPKKKVSIIKKFSIPEEIYELVSPIECSIEYDDLPPLDEKTLSDKEQEMLGVLFSENLAIKCRDIAQKFGVFTLRSAMHQQDKKYISVLGKIEKINEYTSKNGSNYLKVKITDGLWDYSFRVWSNSITDFMFQYKEGDIAIIPLQNRGEDDEHPNDRSFNSRRKGKIIERDGASPDE